MFPEVSDERSLLERSKVRGYQDGLKNIAKESGQHLCLDVAEIYFARAVLGPQEPSINMIGRP
jgi:hypothetical protein